MLLFPSYSSIFPLLSLLPLAMGDNLWGGVQTGVESVEPTYQQAETVYSHDPAAYRVEEHQYQEQPVYQQESFPDQYQQYPEQPQQLRERRRRCRAQWGPWRWELLQHAAPASNV